MGTATSTFCGRTRSAGPVPLPPRSYLLENTPDGFRDVTEELSPALVRPGMVTDAVWADVTGDGMPDLVIAGEWMPLRVFARQESGRLEEVTAQMGLEHTNGFWNVLAADDLDGDGDQDLVAGNRGLNTQVKVGVQAPASLYAADFDRSGTLDAFMSTFIKDKEVLVHWRDAVVTQVPSFVERIPTHESYAIATVQDILTEEERMAATHLLGYVAESSVFENLEGRTLRRASLPQPAQVAPVQDILTGDFDGDSRKDIVVAGNQFGMRAAVGRLDAGRGLVILGDGQMRFSSAGPAGLDASQDVRRLKLLSASGKTLMLVASSNGAIEAYEWLQ